jgi:hypothetical protein
LFVDSKQNRIFIKENFMNTEMLKKLVHAVVAAPNTCNRYSVSISEPDTKGFRGWFLTVEQYDGDYGSSIVWEFDSEIHDVTNPIEQVKNLIDRAEKKLCSLGSDRLNKLEEIGLRL